MNISHEIYLDYAATTPLDRIVIEAMTPYFQDCFGNPSSIHSYGQKAESALEEAREQIAKGLNCRQDEIIFTSGGTESDNLAIRGSAWMSSRSRGARHILISPVEHHAVYHTAQQMADWFGFETEMLPVDSFGQVDPQDVKNRIRKDTALVSVIFGNNEIGTVNRIAEIGAVCRERNVLFHTDAVQAAAHLKLDTQILNTDLISLGAHKFYGPKGVGALYIHKGVEIIPSQTGGGQESKLRAGTQNIPYIVGMAAAYQQVQAEMEDRRNTVQTLRDRIIANVLENIPKSQLTGHPEQRLPNHASFVFHGLDGNTLLMLLDAEGYACSSGSACKTGNPEPSEVLSAIGLSREWAIGSLRVTLSHHTRPEDVELFLSALPDLVAKARRLAK